MKHLPTHILLDLADDYKALCSYAETVDRYKLFENRLEEVDTELLSRIPEGEFVTVYDFTCMPNTDVTLLSPVGFEPYIGEDNEYLSYFWLLIDAIEGRL